MYDNGKRFNESWLSRTSHEGGYQLSRPNLVQCHCYQHFKTCVPCDSSRTSWYPARDGKPLCKLIGLSTKNSSIMRVNIWSGRVLQQFPSAQLPQLATSKQQTAGEKRSLVPVKVRRFPWLKCPWSQGYCSGSDSGSSCWPPKMWWLGSYPIVFCFSLLMLLSFLAAAAVNAITAAFS